MKQIIKILQTKSNMPLENSAEIQRFFAKSLKGKEVITFFNWECPPRTISQRDGKSFVDYDVDLEKIFRGEMIDEFTELPRVIQNRQQEIDTLLWLKDLGVSFRFVKLIADTNAYFLTPESLQILGEKTVRTRLNQFKSLINKELATYPVPAQAILFTDLIQNYRQLYESVYADSLQILTRTPTKLVSKKIFTAQIERTKEHVGLDDPKIIKDFSIKTIASYAAEGVVFAELTKSKAFQNCIWLNNHEIDDRTIAITNCYRLLKKLGKLPMIFVD